MNEAKIDKNNGTEDANVETKKTGTTGLTTRSPNYPFLNLEKSLEYAKIIFDEDRVSQIPTPILLKRWNLPSYNGYTRQILASLNYFGLVDIVGQGDNRKINITNEAFRIFENAPDRDALLKQLALKPKVFAKVWNHYKNTGLPKVDVLETELVWGDTFDFTFTKQGAKNFISNLKSTLEFAKINTEDTHDSQTKTMEGEDETDNLDPPDDNKTTPPAPPKPEEMESYHIPLIGKKNAILSIPRPLSNANYQMISSWLKVMKSALIAEDELSKEDLEENKNED